MLFLSLFVEGLIASGANHIFGIGIELEANDLAAVRAFCFAILILEAAVAILAIAVLVATITVIATEIVAITIAIIAVAVTIVAIAIVVAFVNFAFDFAEVVIKLLCIFGKLVNIGFDIVDFVDHLGNETDKLVYELCLRLCGIKVETLCKTFNISTFFVDSHYFSP